MRWLKRERGKASIALTGLLLLLILMVWVPVSAAGASERALGLAMPGTGTGTVQATLSVDPTMTALQKEQLTLQDDKLKNDNVWAWLSPVSTILGPLATIGTILVGVLVARNNFLQWSKTQEDEQRRREDDRRIEREKRAEDQRVEREKRDEERFQQAVRDLSSQNETAKSGAAIVLRTFLGPKYKQFYEQVFELTVAHLQFSTPPIQMPL